MQINRKILFQNHDNTLPPGPRGWSLLGNLPEFARDVLGFLTSTARDYGDTAYFTITGMPFYLINDPQDIEYVLTRTNGSDFDKTPGDAVSKLVLGNGLLTNIGDSWLRQRRLMQPLFHRQRISGYGETMVAFTDKMLAEWQDDQTLDIHHEMMRLTLNIVTKTLFDVDMTSGRTHAVDDALKVVMDAFSRLMRNPFFTLPIWAPTPTNRRFRHAVAELDRVIFDIIREHRAKHEEKSDLLSTLLSAQDEDGSRMTDQQLRDETMTLILAGHETTALALSWTLYLLAQHSAVEASLREELQQVLNGRAPTVSDLPKLAFTEKVIKEGMRIYPPAWAVDARVAIHDANLSSYPVAKGALILASPWVMHRHPRYYIEPERFNPDRWTEEFAKQLPKFAYFPFGGGPRLCIGNSFAMMEATLILASLIQAFHFELVPDHPVVPQASITLRPKHGIRLTIRRR